MAIAISDASNAYSIAVTPPLSSIHLATALIPVRMAISVSSVFVPLHMRDVSADTRPG
ncbi:hypothetical protein [Burkholderia ubonensis]|uniref:hypothetical protein n=1 Tax=Burkholderia ubonensis TaxID=101571 RepID=UPI001E34FF12|nr:hypothetical protein [Burkholderia ubonensis]